MGWFEVLGIEMQNRGRGTVGLVCSGSRVDWARGLDNFLPWTIDQPF